MQVRMRNRDLQQRGTLQAMSGKMVLRNNSPSSWSINVNANKGNWDRFEEGWGVSLTDSGIFYTSGQVLEIEDEETEDGVRTLALTGASDLSILANSLVIPNPSNPLAQVNQWSATGKAETVLRKLVNEQVGPGAPADYRVPGLILDEDLGRGEEISVSERWSNLQEVLQSQAQTAGLLYDIRQVDENLVFSISEPNDYTRAVRLTRINGGVKSYKLTRTAPTATEVIVGGTGSGATRKMWREPEDGPAETPWGVRITKFVDRQSTSKDTELKQAAQSELESGAAESSVVISAGDTASAKFGRDFWLGDKITIDLGRGEDSLISDTVQIVEVEWNEKGIETKIQVGPEPDESKLSQSSSKLVELVKKLSKQVRQQSTR